MLSSDGASRSSAAAPAPTIAVHVPAPASAAAAHLAGAGEDACSAHAHVHRHQARSQVLSDSINSIAVTTQSILAPHFQALQSQQGELGAIADRNLAVVLGAINALHAEVAGLREMLVENLRGAPLEERATGMTISSQQAPIRISKNFFCTGGSLVERTFTTVDSGEDESAATAKKGKGEKKKKRTKEFAELRAITRLRLSATLAHLSAADASALGVPEIGMVDTGCACICMHAVSLVSSSCSCFSSTFLLDMVVVSCAMRNTTYILTVKWISKRQESWIRRG